MLKLQKYLLFRCRILNDLPEDLEYILPSKSSLALILAGGVVYSLSEDYKLSKLCKYSTETCKHVEASINENYTVIALTDKNELLIDGKKKLGHVSSFYQHPEYLLLTTLQEILISVKYKDIDQLLKHDLSGKPWESDGKECAMQSK